MRQRVVTAGAHHDGWPGSTRMFRLSRVLLGRTRWPLSSGGRARAAPQAGAAQTGPGCTSHPNTATGGATPRPLSTPPCPGDPQPWLQPNRPPEGHVAPAKPWPHNRSKGRHHSTGQPCAPFLPTPAWWGWVPGLEAEEVAWSCLHLRRRMAPSWHPGAGQPPGPGSGTAGSCLAPQGCP